MAWYCKECGDWFIFGYSKKYCSEDCYDEKEERKERKREKKREKRRAEARRAEAKQRELSTLKNTFKDKWGVEYNVNSTNAPKIQKLIKEEKELEREIKKLEALALEITNI